jgi:hypothetical protein
MSFNAKNRGIAQLDTFSGTVTLAQATDIPEGGSPRNQNVDFSVGGAFTRQGLENPFTYANAYVGPGGGGNASVISFAGSPTWENPDNTLLNTGVYATSTLDPLGIYSIEVVNVKAGLETTSYLIVTFTQSVPEYVSGQTYTFSGVTNYTLINGQTYPVLTPGYYTPLSADQAAFSLGSTTAHNPLQPNYSTTPDTGYGVVSGYTAATITDGIDITHFGFSVAPTLTPQGFVVDILNFANSASHITSTLSVQFLKNGNPVGNPVSATMNLNTPGVITVGASNNLFGANWEYSDLNSTGFGVQIRASSNGYSNINVGYVQIQAYFTPSLNDFNFVQTYQDNFGDIYTTALDSGGQVYIEYVNTSPNVLTPLFSGVPANSFATGFTADSRQYLAFSDLTEGVYPPTQIIGTTDAQVGWEDRVSQVGPGAPPSFLGTLSAGSVANITAYSTANSIVTLTANNIFTAGEVVTVNVSAGPTYLNGGEFNVLGTGLSTTQLEVFYSGASGSGSATGNVVPQYTYPISAAPNGITQYPFWNPTIGGPSSLADVLQSSGPGSTDAGTVVTIYYLNAYVYQNGVDINLSTAFNQKLFSVYVYVSGTDLPAANGTQLVTGIGIGTPPGGGDQCYYFTFNVPSSTYVNIGGGTPGQYQLTVATLNTALPLPGVSTGDQVTISSDPISSWNQTWSVVNAINSGIYAISQTSMSNVGVATYNWSLAGGTITAPVAGQLVTVTGTLSGLNPSNTYNVTDAAIQSVTGVSSGTFTVAGFTANAVETVVQQGSLATTSGTKFQIDPGPLSYQNSSDPIYGNSGGGFITLVGSTSVIVGQGTRQGTVFFITRNGYWTRPAAPATFDTTSNTNYILVSNIPIGPENVVARAIVFTEAGQNGQPGGSYYTIPTPVQFYYNNVSYLSSSLIIWDNVTTAAKFTFPDSVLLNATEIDVQGNDLFELNDMASAGWNAEYAGRSVWGLVNNKVQNFTNLSFDGGYNPNPGGNLNPLGWGIDPVNNPSNSQSNLLVSPIFGNSFYISNQTANVAPALGMITQSAYADWNNVPILQNQTPYSVRVTVRTPSSSTSGNLVIDLTSFNSGSGYGITYGSYILPTAQMTSNMVTYEGTLLLSNTLTIPTNLFLRVWAQNLIPGGDIEIDSIDIYPTLEPIDLTGLTFSYKNDLESFDGATGGNDTNVINSQTAYGAFTLLGKLYVVKESSLGHFVDVPDQEPSNWNPFVEDSNVCGACGINAYDVGETWAVMACQNGLFGFNGGAPVQMNLEIPDIWQAINWAAAESIVVRNDTNMKRILISVPMTTPNQWCPDFPVNVNPTENNVMILLNYSGIGTIEELLNAMAMHVTIVGKIAVHDLKRKWSLWSIESPYMDICKRSNLFSEMLICNGINSSKIYQLGSYQSGEDDSVPFTSSYCMYGFVSAEKESTQPIFGLLNKRYIAWDALISGSGTANLVFYQNVLSAPYPFTVPGGIQLTDPAFNNIQGPLDEYGQRIFPEVKINGGYFNLSRFTVIGKMDSWSPWRGF